MNTAAAHLLRRLAQALRLVADTLDPITPVVVHTHVNLDGRKVAESIRRNGGGGPTAAHRS